MASNINKYKSEISLPDFLINNFGFKVDKGSSRNYPKLKGPNMTIVIKRNSLGHYTYFDIHDSSRDSRGKTIIDFVQDHLSASLPEGRKVSLRDVFIFLDNYIKLGKAVSPDQSTFKITGESITQEEIQKIVHQLKPFKDRQFLYDRGITDKTIDNPLFSDSIYNKEYINPDNGKVYTNTAFKMFSPTGTMAISQRNHNLKGCLGSRSESLCATHYDKKTPIDKLFIGESFLDCMSHFQLNENDLKGKNIIYLSSEGNLVESQISLIQSIVSNVNPKEISTIFDNDIQGTFYNAELIGKLSFPCENVKDIENTITFNENLNLYPVNAFKNDNYSSLEFIVPVKNSVETINTYFESIVHRANGELKETFEGNTFNSFISYDKDNLIKFCISFPTSYNAWEKALDIVTSFKLCNSQFLNIEKPLLFDYNDDLTYSIGKNKDFSIKENDSGRLMVYHKGKEQFEANKNLIQSYGLKPTQKGLTDEINI